MTQARLTAPTRPVVLVVDDVAMNRELLEGYLLDLGYEVRMATDGLEAFESILMREPDLILLDIDMPRKDGYQVCEEIKADPATRGAHVLILTAFAQEFQKEKARASGADEIITKPFSPRKLRERIVEILGAVEKV